MNSVLSICDCGKQQINRTGNFLRATSHSLQCRCSCSGLAPHDLIPKQDHANHSERKGPDTLKADHGKYRAERSNAGRLALTRGIMVPRGRPVYFKATKPVAPAMSNNGILSQPLLASGRRPSYGTTNQSNTSPPVNVANQP